MGVKGGGHTTGLLLLLVDRLARDELVLFELGNDIRTGMEATTAKPTSLDKFNMKLAARDAARAVGRGGRRGYDGGRGGGSELALVDYQGRGGLCL